VGNAVDSNVSNYRLRASERQQLSYGADATPVCYLCGFARANQSRVDLLAANQSRADLQHTLATAVKI